MKKKLIITAFLVLVLLIIKNMLSSSKEVSPVATTEKE